VAVVSVSFDGTRVDSADTIGTVWTQLGGGKAASEEVDFVYQGNSSASVQVKTSEGGVQYYNSATSHNLETGSAITGPRTVIFKHIATNKDILNVEGSTGGILEVGSGDRANYYRYYVIGSDTYPKTGGWLITPIDPNVSGYRDDTVGSPDLAVVDNYNWVCTFTGSSKVENVAMDAIDFVDNGTGLTLVGGDGASTDGVFQDFADYDEGTVGNSYGICTTKEGIFYVVGVLTIGTATSTEFTDSGQVIVFPDGRFDAGFCGIDFGLQSTGEPTTSITIDDCVFKGRGVPGDSPEVADTRPDYSATGTTSTLALTGCTFDVFRNMDWTSGVTLTSCIFINGLYLKQNGATIASCTISNATTGDGVAFIESDDPELISNCDFTFSDGHAIEITTAGEYDFTLNSFTGYGADESSDAAIYNNSGGNVILNLLGAGVATPTVRNESPSTTTLNNGKTVSVHVSDSDGASLLGVLVAIYTDPGLVEVLNTETDSAGDVSATYNYTGDQAITIRVRESPNQSFGRYVPFFGTGTITDTGFSLDVLLQDDDIAQVT
jgi:hypothetical protein